MHSDTKAISTVQLFKTNEGNVTSIQLLENEQFKEHISKVPALLICLTGESVFENEKGDRYALTSGAYVSIEPQIRHWINAKSTSILVLIK